MLIKTGCRLLTGLLLLPLPLALAQDNAVAVVQQQRCWLGSMGYSPGATARAGNAVLVCGADFTWSPTHEWAAGCVHGGDLYAVGAIQNGSGQQQVLTRCQPDGSWETVTAGDPG